ncbi:flagellar basal body P-ring formation chaperone FlgA [Aestuariibius sp. HNIBRBA575]|uniref:flagellar basal body P-ring formation chaperone FlgA n=1 Tax=Aestuariibius sp. HNIBRBA575 TaxID=3233343 RepID=UPI0034A51B6F
MKFVFFLLFAFSSAPAFSETLLASRTIRSQEIIGPEDVVLAAGNYAGGVSDPSLLIGMEARVALYAGRPIRLGDVSTPAVVERNAIITLIYDRAGLVISTEGRALERAAAGDYIRVMNLASRTTITARVEENGSATVSN